MFIKFGFEVPCTTTSDVYLVPINHGDGDSNVNGGGTGSIFAWVGG